MLIINSCFQRIVVDPIKYYIMPYDLNKLVRDKIITEINLIYSILLLADYRNLKNVLLLPQKGLNL